MTPADLLAWRIRMGITKGEAAAALGLSPNGYGAYERGYVMYTEKRGIFNHAAQADRPIPRHVELACERLEQLATHSQPVHPEVQTHLAVGNEFPNGET